MLRNLHSIITIIPVSDFSKSLFPNRDTITFVRQEFAIDTIIHFDRIKFHTSLCLGTCSIFHLEINSKRKVKLFAEEVYKDDYSAVRDKSKEGYFDGQHDENTYKNLINLIQTCNLKTPRLDSSDCCYGSLKTLIFYFNSQRKYYKTMFGHPIVDRLISRLYSICKKNGLNRARIKFNVEE